MNILTYLNSLRPALPFSAEGECIPMSNGELRRLLKNKAIIINGENNWAWDEEVPPLVWQLVFFPKSTKEKPPIRAEVAPEVVKAALDELSATTSRPDVTGEQTLSALQAAVRKIELSWPTQAKKQPARRTTLVDEFTPSIDWENIFDGQWGHK